MLGTHLINSHSTRDPFAGAGKSLYSAGLFAALWYDPDFSAHSLAAAECGDGKRTGREPCDGDDFGDLGVLLSLCVCVCVCVCCVALSARARV